MRPGELAGVLLTGGRSSRLGRDKALLPLGPRGTSLAQHLGELLLAVTSRAIEVGPGRSGLPLPTAPDPGAGPLVAVALARDELESQGFSGPALVLATDLPRLTLELLSTVARWPAPDDSSVLPVVGGRPQYLSARWSPGALDKAVLLAAGGERRVQAAFEEDACVLLDEDDLPAFDLAFELSDVDAEEDLSRLGFDLPPLL